MDQQLISQLGPLAQLVGTWEGTTGNDVAPSQTRGVEISNFRERMIFQPFGPVNNHEQILFGLKYSTTAWRMGEVNPFHEDMGYWLWDKQDSQVMKCFVIPRGISLIAGGTVQADAKSFKIQAKDGSNTYGICHNLFLEKEFKIVGFELKIEFLDSKTLTYEQDTLLKMKSQKDIFHHKDKNTLKLVSD